MKVEIKSVLFIFFVFLFSLFIFPPKTSAQVVINEIKYKNGSYAGEWVELYNTGETVNIGNWTIEDNNASDILPSVILPAGSFAVIVTSDTTVTGIDSTATIIQLSGSDSTRIGNGLADTGDRVILKDGLAEIVDQMSYGSDETFFSLEGVTSGHSLERIPAGIDMDIASDFTDQPNPTPGAGASPIPSPSPSLSPSPTPSSTPTETPTPTPKPTVKAVVTKKPKVISTKTTSDESETEVLGLREGLEAPSPTPIPESEEKGKIPITALLFVLGGLGFMGVAGYPFLKSMKKRYNIENEEKETAEGDFKPGDS